MKRGDFSKCNLASTVLEAAGKPNEYNTATFIQYDNIIKPTGPFSRFFNDPHIQESLHVRGNNLPGKIIINYNNNTLIVLFNKKLMDSYIIFIIIIYYYYNYYYYY
jgi:hypothetical protein